MRGSWMCGPEAFSTVDGSHRITEYRASSGLQSGSSAGASLATIALRNPAASNAGCQSSMPFFTYGTHFAGVAGST